MTARYTDTVRAIVRQFDPSGSNRYFLFGSSVRNERFRDIDVGVVGNAQSRKPLSRLHDLFYDSPIPYSVDVVDFDAADAEFKTFVFQNEPIVWIQ